MTSQTPLTQWRKIAFVENKAAGLTPPRDCIPPGRTAPKADGPKVQSRAYLTVLQWLKENPGWHAGMDISRGTGLNAPQIQRAQKNLPEMIERKVEWRGNLKFYIYAAKEQDT